MSKTVIEVKAPPKREKSFTPQLVGDNTIKEEGYDPNVTTRKRLYRPKVYEYWTPEDDKKRLMEDKLQKEAEDEEELRRQMKEDMQEGRHLDWLENDDVDDDDEGPDDPAILLFRQKDKEQREKEYLARVAEQERKQKEMEDAERIKAIRSELSHPNKYGWFYTNGYYREDVNESVGLNEKWVNYFRNEEKLGKAQRAASEKETFKEKWRHHFWPPDMFFQNTKAMPRTFRTRGIYMDFKEIQEDWPEEIDVYFGDLGEKPPEESENKVETLDDEEYQKKMDELRRTGYVGGIMVLTEVNWYWWDFYYDDEIGLFFHKRPGFDILYYFDPIAGCYRFPKKDKPKPEKIRTPYDYYYDMNEGKFWPREWYRGESQWYYDSSLNIWKLRDQVMGRMRKTKGMVIITTQDLQRRKAKRDAMVGKKRKKPKFNQSPPIGAEASEEESGNSSDDEDGSVKEDGVKKKSKKKKGPKYQKFKKDERKESLDLDKIDSEPDEVKNPLEATAKNIENEPKTENVVTKRKGLTPKNSPSSPTTSASPSTQSTVPGESSSVVPVVGEDNAGTETKTTETKKVKVEEAETVEETYIKKMPDNLEAQPDRPRKKKKNKPVDYYYDECKANWLLLTKAPKKAVDKIDFDQNGLRWTRKCESEWRGITGLSPDDFYFNPVEGKFHPKPNRQPQNFKYIPEKGCWVKIGNESFRGGAKNHMGPHDYYWEDLEGQFKPKVPNHEEIYRLRKWPNIYFHRPIPRSLLYPQDFYWDYEKRAYLPRSLRRPLLLEHPKEKVPWLEKTGKAQLEMQKQFKRGEEMYYWDAEEGWFQMKTPYDKYVFEDGLWVSVSQKERLQKIVPYANSYYWDSKKCKFLKKNENAPEDTYTYSAKEGFWRKAGEPKQDKCDPPPSAYQYDAKSEKWELKKGGGTKSKDKDEKSDAPRTPDNFVWHDQQGKFLLKGKKSNKYYLDQKQGVWRIKGLEKTIPKSGLLPRDFFWDDYSRQFRLKVRWHEKDYIYDRSLRVYRRPIMFGKTKSGLKPEDFEYVEPLGKYFPKKKNWEKRKREREAEWDVARNYNKPWLAPKTKDPEKREIEEIQREEYSRGKKFGGDEMRGGRVGLLPPTGPHGKRQKVGAKVEKKSATWDSPEYKNNPNRYTVDSPRSNTSNNRRNSDNVKRSKSNDSDTNKKPSS